MRHVAIFRHNLFRISEPFITQQAEQLRRYTPLYLGRLRFGAAPEGADSLALQDLAPRCPWPLVGWQMLGASPRPWQRLLGERRPALIHAHFGIEGVYALPLARRLGVPLVTTFHGFDATLSTAALLCQPAWARYALGRHRLARDGSLFLCASAFIRERILALGFPAERAKVHYIGVDCDAVAPRDEGEETPTVLHVARLVPVKGTSTLIRAFAAVAGRRREVRLVIVGDGPLKQPLEREARSLGVADRIRFLGARPHAEVMGLMRRAAVVALPSVRTGTGRVEGLGMTLLEAAATGVPVVASDLGGIPECVLDGQTGFLVPERDAGALAGRIEDLLADPALRRRMGGQARALVERRFDLCQQTKTLESLYDSVL
jgi:glycosyltransferase involved in cell wall biosynthesis